MFHAIVGLKFESLFLFCDKVCVFGNGFDYYKLFSRHFVSLFEPKNSKLDHSFLRCVPSKCPKVAALCRVS